MMDEQTRVFHYTTHPSIGIILSVILINMICYTISFVVLAVGILLYVDTSLFYVFPFKTNVETELIV